MYHELFHKATFAEMEKHLEDHKHDDFTLKGADLLVLIFLTKSITCAELHRELTASIKAGEDAQALVSRIRDATKRED